MAVVVNRKQLMSLLLLCFITAAVIPPWAAAQQAACSGLMIKLSPCLGYILNGGEIPPACCGGLKTIVDGLKTQQDKRTACQCMKDGLSKATADQLKRAQGLPGYCKVTLPFPISLTVDCSKIQKRIA